MEEKAMVIEMIGTIGAGKSTMAKGLQKAGWPCVLEPSEEPEWREAIALFYLDQRRWAYLFQTVAFTLRARAWRETLAGLHGDSDYVVCERTVHADRGIFAWMLSVGDDPKLSDVEWNAYNRLWGELPHSSLVKPSGIIYLKIPPALAFERIKERGRESEQGIPLEYLVALDAAHERYVAQMEQAGVEIMQIDATRSKDEVLDETLRKLAHFEDAAFYEASRR